MANYKRKRKRSKRKSDNPPSNGKLFLVACVAALLLYILWPSSKSYNLGPDEMGCDAALENYGDDISRLAGKYDLSKEYLMSLIMLECSGRRNVPARFEKGVYKKLLDVKAGKKTLEGISKDELRDASDEALRNLASSWGPFQLMGYKCFHLNIQIKDLRGENSLEHGVDWINRTYGDYIRQGRYADAFHIHNTGRPVPQNGKYQTYDPKYVPMGLTYMETFREKMK